MNGPMVVVAYVYRCRNCGVEARCTVGDLTLLLHDCQWAATRTVADLSGPTRG